MDYISHPVGSSNVASDTIISSGTADFYYMDTQPRLYARKPFRLEGSGDFAFFKHSRYLGSKREAALLFANYFGWIDHLNVKTLTINDVEDYVKSEYLGGSNGVRPSGERWVTKSGWIWVLTEGSIKSIEGLIFSPKKSLWQKIKEWGA